MGCCNSKQTKKPTRSTAPPQKQSAETEFSDEAFDDLGHLEPRYHDEGEDEDMDQMQDEDGEDAEDQDGDDTDRLIGSQPRRPNADEADIDGIDLQMRGGDNNGTGDSAEEQRAQQRVQQRVQQRADQVDVSDPQWFEKEQMRRYEAQQEQLEQSRQYIRQLLSHELRAANDPAMARPKQSKHKITFEEINDDASAANTKKGDERPPVDEDDEPPPLEDQHSQPVPKPSQNSDAKSPVTKYIQSLEKRTICIEPGLAEMCNFVIEECRNCDIFICNPLTNVTIDRCFNCRIFAGPCKELVRISNTDECSFILAATEIQMLQCKKCDLRVFAKKCVKIHLCLNLRIGCFAFSYAKLAEHFSKVGLSVFNNRWSEVKDLSSLRYSWSFLPDDVTPEVMMPTRPPERMINMKRSSLNLVVPLMHGMQARTGDEDAFVLFLPDRAPAALQCIESLLEKGHHLLQSREVKLKSSDLEKVIQCFSHYTDHRKSRQNFFIGPTIGLLFNGKGCREAMFDMSQVYNQIDSYPFIFTTTTAEATKTAVDIFFASSRERKGGKQ
eukprot:TRINITY_DN5025_c0_g1_i1.p1 TRINITY_DN5025_c0_g1~~TRINITY_DN5025_c0_g1_i1.p1  ORF type:complete len:554 (-),score=106.14 TRINITY_DN5025_c0_g1_i1:122-1783(-)